MTKIVLTAHQTAAVKAILDPDGTGDVSDHRTFESAVEEVFKWFPDATRDAVVDAVDAAEAA